MSKQKSGDMVKKNFISLFIITIILMISSFTLITFYQYNLNIHKISILTTIITLCIFLLMFIILLIIQARKNIYMETNIRNNENMMTLTSIVIFGVVILSLVSIFIDNMLFAERSELMIDDANKLVSLVESQNKENYAFMLSEINDFKLSKSPFGNKYKNNSYITTFNGNNNVCLTDGKYSIIKNNNTKELELADGDICNFELEENEAALFINSKLFEKYNISFEVYNCKRNYDYDSVFNNKTGITCEIKYNNESYSATLYDEKLELKDSYVGGYDEK